MQEKSCKLQKKVSPVRTLLAMKAGDELTIREDECRFHVIYNTSRRIMRTTDAFYEVSVKGIVGATRVRRLR